MIERDSQAGVAWFGPTGCGHNPGCVMVFFLIRVVVSDAVVFGSVFHGRSNMALCVGRLPAAY